MSGQGAIEAALGRLLKRAAERGITKESSIHDKRMLANSFVCEKDWHASALETWVRAGLSEPAGAVADDYNQAARAVTAGAIRRHGEQLRKAAQDADRLRGERNALIRELVRSGESKVEIARICGISRNRVYQILDA